MRNKFTDIISLKRIANPFFGIIIRNRWQKWHPRKSSKVMRQKFEGFVCPEAQAHSGYVAGQ